MKIGLILGNRRKENGAQISDNLFEKYLRKTGAQTKIFTPRINKLSKIPLIGGYINAYSHLSNKKEIEKQDILYSSNASGMAFAEQKKAPLVAVFRCTGRGIVSNVPKNTEKYHDFYVIQKQIDFAKKTGIEFKIDLRTAVELTTYAEEYTAQNATQIVAVSKQIKQQLIKLYKIKVDKIAVIHNAVPDIWFKEYPSRCQSCSKLVPTKKKFTIIWVARWASNMELDFKLKGIDRALEVFSRIKDAEKLVFGLTKQPKNYVKLFNKVNARFYPNFPYAHLPHLEKMGDVFIQCSRYEAFGLSLIEAMASGLTPVSFPIGIAPEIIWNGENGFLVENIEEMIKRVSYLKENPDICKKMGKAAQASVKQKFTMHRMTRDYLNLFNRILSI